MSVINQYYELNEENRKKVEDLLLIKGKVANSEKEITKFVNDLKSGKLKNRENIELDIIYPDLEENLKNILESLYIKKSKEDINVKDIISLSPTEMEKVVYYLMKEPKAKGLANLLEKIISGKVKYEQIDTDGFSKIEEELLKEAYFYSLNSEIPNTIKFSEFKESNFSKRDSIISIETYDELEEIISKISQIDSSTRFFLKNNVACGSADVYEDYVLSFKACSEIMKKRYINNRIGFLEYQDLKKFSKKIGEIIRKTENLNNELDIINLVAISVYENSINENDVYRENSIKMFNNKKTPCIEQSEVAKIILDMKKIKCRIRQGVAKKSITSGQIESGHAWLEVWCNDGWRCLDCARLACTLENDSHLNTIKQYLERNGYVLRDNIISTEEINEIGIEEVNKSFERIRKSISRDYLEINVGQGADGGVDR